MNKVTCHHNSVGPAPEVAVTVHLVGARPFVDVLIGEVENTVFRPTREELRGWLEGVRAKVDAAIGQLADAPVAPQPPPEGADETLPAAQVAI